MARGAPMNLTLIGSSHSAPFALDAYGKVPSWTEVAH